MRFFSRLTGNVSSLEFISNRRGAQERLFFVGTLFERKSLLQKLSLPLETSDITLIKSLLLAYEENAYNHLNGEFSIIRHNVTSGTVTLIADHLGTVPMFWYLWNSRLYCANRMCDLLEIVGRELSVDQGAIASFMRLPRGLQSHTFFQNVEVLTGGQEVVISSGRVRKNQYWSPQHACDVRFSQQSEYVEAITTLIDSSVVDRLVDCNQPASHLSAGLDSMAVTARSGAYLDAKGTPELKTYSWSPPISQLDNLIERDERLRIQDIDELLKIDTQFNEIDGFKLRAFLERPIELEGLSNTFDELEVLEKAKRDKVDLILSGWGGDECFSFQALGVPAYLLQHGQLRKAIACLRTVHAVNKGRSIFGAWHKLIYICLVMPLLSRKLQYVFPYFSAGYDSQKYISQNLVNSSIGTEDGPRHRISSNPAEEIRDLLAIGHLGERTRTWWEWGHQFNVRYSYPLLDRRVLEFILGCPPELHWGDSKPRYFARSLLRSSGLQFRMDKSDPAVESQRYRAYCQCWKILRAEVQKGFFDDDCYWLDTQKIRQDILKGPSDNQLENIHRFGSLMVALKIWFFARRFGFCA